MVRLRMQYTSLLGGKRESVFFPSCCGARKPVNEQNKLHLIASNIVRRRARMSPEISFGALASRVPLKHLW